MMQEEVKALFDSINQAKLMGTSFSIVWQGLFASIVAGFVAIIVANKNGYISAVTVERVRWNGELRKNISKLLAQGADHLYLENEKKEIEKKAQDEGSEEVESIKTKINESRKEMEILINLIKLQLDPVKGDTLDKKIQNNILILLDSFSKKTGISRFESNGSHLIKEPIYDENLYREYEAVFMQHSRFLLKNNWEETKKEASMFRRLYVLLFNGDEWMRKNEYCELCRKTQTILGKDDMHI